MKNKIIKTWAWVMGVYSLIMLLPMLIFVYSSILMGIVFSIQQTTSSFIMLGIWAYSMLFIVPYSSYLYNTVIKEEEE